MAIGKVIIDLEAQHASFSRGIHEVKEEVAGLGESVESIKGLFEGAFAIAGIEIGAGAIKEMIGHTMEETAEAYRLSSALGITTQSLQELQTAGLLGAGIKADEFNGILQKMTKALGEAEGGTGPAAEALTKLGLSGSELKGQHLDQAFISIAEKISQIKDPAEQARAATELFGREGQKLLPLFQEGSEGIKAAAEEADKLGIAMSDTDSAKVMQANESFEKMGLAVQGVENQLVVALAPVLEQILNKVLSLVPAASTMQNAFVTGLKYVAEGVGYVIDAWHVMQLGGEAVSVAIVAAIEGIIWVVKELADGVVWVANKLGADWKEPAFFQDTINLVDDWRKNIVEQMNGTVDQLAHPESEKWGKFFDDIQSKAQETAQAMADHKNSIAAPITADFTENAKKIQAIIDGLEKQISEFGLTEAQKKVKELQELHADPSVIAAAEADAKKLDSLNQQKKITEEITKLQLEAAQAGMTAAEKQVDNLRRGGANADQIAQANGLQEEIKAMQDWKKEQEDANKLIEESRSPIEKYQDELDKIQKMYMDGLLSDSQADDALAKAAKDYGKKEDGDEIKKAALETRRFDFRLPQTPQKEDAGQKALQVAQDHLKQAQDQSYWQEQLYLFGLADQNSGDVIFDTF